MKTLLIICAVLLALPCITLATPIPDTGQTKCYNNTQEIACSNPGEPFYGQDANYALCNPHSYTKLDANGNPLSDSAPWPWGMVRDNVTGLIWEVKTLRDNTINYSNPHDADNLYYWSDAIGDGTGAEDFINALNAENYGGYTDWRLPTVKELSSIVNRDSCNPAINTTYFPDIQWACYWSSTTHVRYYPVFAWRVCFSVQGINYESKGKAFRSYARAVRSGESGLFSSFIDNGDGTVSDTDTGLMWQKDTAPGIYTWEQSLHYCDTLSHAGYSDWRLPNVNELQSIVDYDRYDPSIDPVFNYSLMTCPWSSTTHAEWPHNAWLVCFGDGNLNIFNKSDNGDVRAVRGGKCDSDGDGVLNNDDNCPMCPNGNILGAYSTVTGGVVIGTGVTCSSYEDYQEDEYCDMVQADCNANGIGDVCECYADVNCSNKIDLADLVIMKQEFLQSCPCQADCNGDNQVNLGDLVIMKTQFLRTDCPMSSYLRCMEECESELEICLIGCEGWSPDSRYICNDNCVFNYSSNCVPTCN